jgi:hypothetical protein
MLLLAGCGRKQLSPQAYLNWINSSKSELTKTGQMDEYEFSASYRPKEYLALLQLRNREVTAQNLKAAEAGYDSLYCFLFKIATADHKSDILQKSINSPSEYYSRLQYFLKDIKNDFKLVDGKDTIDCSLCQFERTYNISPYSDFELYFNRPVHKSDNDLLLIYNDQILKSGPINLLFSSRTLGSLPTIKI